MLTFTVTNTVTSGFAIDRFCGNSGMMNVHRLKNSSNAPSRRRSSIWHQCAASRRTHQRFDGKPVTGAHQAHGLARDRPQANQRGGDECYVAERMVKLLKPPAQRHLTISKMSGKIFMPGGCFRCGGSTVSQVVTCGFHGFFNVVANIALRGDQQFSVLNSTWTRCTSAICLTAFSTLRAQACSPAIDEPAITFAGIEQHFCFRSYSGVATAIITMACVRFYRQRAELCLRKLWCLRELSMRLWVMIMFSLRMLLSELTPESRKFEGAVKTARKVKYTARGQS